jgi:two-component system CheB/CheR fusion protein
MAAGTSSALDALLEHLKKSRGFDFTGYKRASLERRIARRMAAVGAEDHAEYLDRLEVDPGEFQHLFDTILINVTGFYRDPAAWAYLADEIVPQLLEQVGPDAPVRVWCAGCASGEETYSLAMLLATGLGEEEYCERVKIYATDVDEDALATARAAVYDAKDVESVPREELERFFRRSGTGYAFRKELRRTVIFGRNDLVQDAPISRIDLLSCRNTLMYLNAETQARALSRFHFALKDPGFLFLGRSEMLVKPTKLFAPVNLKQRVFRKVGDGGVPAPLGEELKRPVLALPPAGILSAAFDLSPVAQVVVDAEGVIGAANVRARMLFGLGAADVGRPLKDLELSYRPVDLRSSLDAAFGQRRGAVLGDVRFRTESGEELDLEVHVDPLLDGRTVLGAAISFFDITALGRLRDELDGSRVELENAYEELQSTVEELETTNEELQSTNEELETTNEELQAGNEELETMNEELQSTNEELAAINDELRRRTAELDDVNAFLQTILTSMGLAVVVLDDRRAIEVWNEPAAELWGVRPEEASGRKLPDLDTGLPVGELEPELTAVLDGTEPRAVLVLDATNRRGHAIRCRVTVLPMRAVPDQVSGAILLMEEDGDRT